MKINKLTISNFKGIPHIAIHPTDRYTIAGQNGIGKTTIADAYYWLFCGKDSKLTDNPNVIPIGSTECQPTVEVELDIDGKIVTVKKSQKYKVKDGKESSHNDYFVNEVPMGTEKAYKDRLSELGIDTDMFLVLSHPDYLLRDTTKKNRDYIRNEILFPMAESKSDKEIAEIKKLKELSAMLNDYKLNEVEAMQKATLKKISDEIGKDNTIANARIDELSRSKSGIDSKAIEKEINAVSEKIAKNIEAQQKVKSEKERIEADILNLTFDRNGLSTKLLKEYHDKQRDLKDKLADLKEEIRQTDNAADDLLIQTKVKAETIESTDGRIKHLQERIEKLNFEVLDEQATICPTCGRSYGNGQINAIREQYEKKKQADIKSCKDEIAELEEVQKKTKAEIDQLESKYKDTHNKSLKLEKDLKPIQDELDNLVEPNVEDSKEYKEIVTKIKALETKKAELSTGNLEAVESSLRSQLSQYKYELAKADMDKEADERIAEIRNEIKQAEINRANAEKVLYQIEILNKAKNEMLEKSVNKHFKLVKWKLFKTLKNGNYEDACIPMIDGYELGTSANKGREILAKLDIIDGLSEFYQHNLPILLDNAESLSSETEKRIETDNQLIMFKVSEDDGFNFKEDCL